MSIMSLLITLAAFAVAIGVLVTVHEFGHYWVARRNGVKIEKFSIGFGRPLLKWVAGADRTQYIIAAFPLGGYVKMLGEGGEEEVPEADKARAFNNKTLLQRTSIVFAGPLFNLIFALLLYWFLSTGSQTGFTPHIAAVTPGSIAAEAGLLPGQQIMAVHGEATPTWMTVADAIKPFLFEKRPVDIRVRGNDGEYELTLNLRKVDLDEHSSIEEMLGLHPLIPVSVDSVVPDTAAADAGLQADDRLLSLNGVAIANGYDFIKGIQDSAGKPLTLGIDRDGISMNIELQPRQEQDKDKDGNTHWRIGANITSEHDVTYHVGVWHGLQQASAEVWDMSYLTLNMFYRMATGQASLKNLSGPVTIAEYAGKTAQISFESFISFLAIVSISLGVINLLPIPLLDGGHLLYYAIEAVKGSPVSEKSMEIGLKIGIVIILLLMSIAISNDIQRLLN